MRLPSFVSVRSLAPAVAVALAIAGCYPKAGPVPATPTGPAAAAAVAKWPGTTEASLTEGHDLFNAHCNQCHSHPDVNSKPADKWPGIVEEMAKKAKLDDTQRDKVLHFVLAARTAQP